MRRLFHFAIRLLRFPTRASANGNASVEQKEPSVEEAFRALFKTNVARWGPVEVKEPSENDDKRVLIESLCPHPGYVLVQLVSGRHIMNIYGMQGAALLRSPNRKFKQLYESYGITEFYYLSDRKQGVLDQIRYALKAVALIKGVHGIDEFIQLKVGEVSFGKIVYDTYLRTSGYGTANNISLPIFGWLISILSYHEYLEEMFGSGRFPVVFQGERQFIPSAVVCQVALEQGSVIYGRGGGPSIFTIRIYDKIEEIYTETERHREEFFNYIYDNYREVAVKEGGDYIFNRFKGKSPKHDILEASFAFKKDEKNVSREELCKRFGWDVERPIAVVMGNVMVDGVFVHNWSLFRDNLTWLCETLKAIIKIDHVNWLVKKHPLDERDDVITTARLEYERWAKEYDHIQFLTDDVNPLSLTNIADVILTAHGHAGGEYSCFGIPCILAGESSYSGLGFTYEPQTQEEYFSLLERIHTIGPLEKSQVEKAKTYAFIYCVLSRVESKLIPLFSRLNDYDERKLWEDAKNLLSNCEPKDDRLYKMLRIQIKNRYQHLLNYDWVDMV